MARRLANPGGHDEPGVVPRVDASGGPRRRRRSLWRTPRLFRWLSKPKSKAKAKSKSSGDQAHGAQARELMAIRIVGGGLAGSEAAWQAASRGVPVTLYEMRPVRPTAVHKTDRLAELVCSNSFRGDKLDNAVGLLKEEMRRLGSLVLRAAEESRVPAGAALAVDRERFSELVTRALHDHPLVTIVRDEVAVVPRVHRSRAGDYRERSTDLGGALEQPGLDCWRERPLFLRRYQSDRPRRNDRSVEGIPRSRGGTVVFVGSRTLRR